MSVGFECLYSAGTPGKESAGSAVDVVAVPDIYPVHPGPWTHPASQINWLKELLPDDVTIGRVLVYNYEASAASFFGKEAPARTQRLAEAFVQELRCDRSFAGTLKRPIIFVCHGLGGILVKKSLIFSSTRTAPKIVHLWDQFISTFAILFFGTPHADINPNAWFELEKQQSEKHGFKFRPGFIGNRPKELLMSSTQSVNVDFTPHMKQFHMYFFWEELTTDMADHHDFIVPPESAAPAIEDTEATGIHATHTGMVQFESRASPGYRLVADAISRYCGKAPKIISHRWNQATAALQRVRAGEVWEMGGLGFDVRLEEPFQHVQSQPASRAATPKPRQCVHFYPPESATPCYIGRQRELDEISAAFAPQASFKSGGNSRGSVFVLFGMGGSGKTELSARYAEEYSDRYEAVFTIRSANKETIADSFKRIGKIAGMEPTEAAGRHCLAQLSGTWLLIIDNADDWSMDLHGLIPKSKKAHVLITTRCPDFRQQNTCGYLELKGLNKVEALQLLLTRADIPEPWDKATQDNGNVIAEYLGYLAIALTQAGNCVFRGICRLGEYLQLHSSERSSLKPPAAAVAMASDESDKEALLPKIYGTFEMSLTYLSSRTQTLQQDISDLLKIMAFYHFENIPIDAFSRAINNVTREFEANSSLSFGQTISSKILSRLSPPKLLPGFLKPVSGRWDRYRINKAVAELRSLSLINSDGRHISLHPLVHAWAKDSLSPNERKVWASVALSTLLEAVSIPPLKGESLADFHRDILPHLETCLKMNELTFPIPTTAMGKFLLKTSAILRPTMIFTARDRIKAMAKCGLVFAERSLFDEAASHLQNVAEALDFISKNDEKTLMAKLFLAKIFWWLGRLEEAIAVQYQVLNIRSQTFGENHIETLKVMTDLGRSYWSHGNYVKALELQQITVERMESVIRSDKHENYDDLLTAWDYLGVTLGSWRRFDESLEFHQRVLKARIDKLGRYHDDTLATRDNLAMAQLDLGHLDEALLNTTEVYEKRREQLGKEHASTLWALCNHSKVLIELGRLDDAVTILTWGIEAAVRTLGENHIGVGMGRGALARAYARQNRLDEALSLTKRVLATIKSSRGEANFDYLFGLWKQAQLFILKDDTAEAIKTAQRALAAAEERLTLRHPLAEDLKYMIKVLSNPEASPEAKIALTPEVYAKMKIASASCASEPETLTSRSVEMSN